MAISFCRFFIVLPLLLTTCVVSAASILLPRNTVTLYRAIKKDDLQKHASQYTVGKSPTTFMTAKGDFSPHGGLYAFTEEKEAIFWGNSFQMMDPKTPFYVVTYHYTPTATMKRFQSADAQWLDWIQKCNAGKMPATRLPQAVEGPISVGKNAGKSKLDGRDLIQIAIVDEAALKDVRVAKIEGYCYDKAWQGNPKGTPTPKPCKDRSCPCTAM